MDNFDLLINGQEQRVEADPHMPLLWVLRDLLNLTGTKFGCGVGLCAACTVLVDGETARACITPVASLTGKAVTTIEGLAAKGLHKVQQAWLAEAVSQCGYCQPGKILTVVALLDRNPQPTDLEIDEAFKDNLCRCGTYLRIRRAVRRAAEGGQP